MPLDSIPSSLKGPLILVEVSSNTVSLSRQYLDPNLPNEEPLKVKCGLGNFTEGSKTLDPESVAKVLSTLDSWFENIIDKCDHVAVDCVATGALREAEDGQEFLDAFEKRYGHKLELISGKDEAHYAARGVRDTLEDVEGIVFDQGGRSTEFAIVKPNGDIKHKVSLPLGTFSIAEQDKPNKYIREQLDKLPKAYQKPFERIYAVGGSPKQVLNSLRKDSVGAGKLHGYTVAMDDAVARAKDIKAAEPEELRDAFHISKSRVDLVPSAARLFLEMQKRFEVDTITASTAGFRDGVLAEQREQVLATHAKQPKLVVDNAVLEKV